MFSQTDSCEIEQYCMNYFCKYILIEDISIPGNKFYFSGVTEKEETIIDNIAQIRFNIDTVKNGAQKTENVRQTRKVSIAKKHLLRKRKNNSYTLKIFTSIKIHERNYVQMEVDNGSKGYYIYFEVENCDKPLRYTSIPFIR